MFDRIRFCAVHPSQIARLFRDKFYHILITFLVFFVPFAVVSGVVNINASYFTYDDAIVISESLAHTEESADVVYENGVMSGSEYIINSGSAYFVFNSDKVASSGLTFGFKEEKVTISLSGITFKEISYSNLSKDGFSMEKVRLGSTTATAGFQALLGSLFDAFNPVYGTYVFGANLLSGLFIYAIILVICLFASFLFNRDLDFKVRIRLVFYATLVYFVVMTFAVGFGFEPLEYVAMILPMFYMSAAVRHLVRIKPKGAK